MIPLPCWTESRPRRAILAAAAILGAGCARPALDEPAMMTPNQAWIASTCDAGSPADSTWPRYRLGDITIAVPAEYRVSESVPYTLRFRGSFGTLSLTLHRNARYLFDDMNRARRKQNWCRASYGGFQTEVLAWNDLGHFNLIARWEATWGGQDAGKWLFAQVSASKVEDAAVLRDVLHTIAVAKDALRQVRTPLVTRTAHLTAQAPLVASTDVRAQGSSPEGWLQAPCEADSVDSFEWTRYDLRGLRIRVPRDIRRVPHPDVNELHFQKGRARLRLRVHNDANRLFAEYYTPDKTYRYCQGEMSGRAVEAISFRFRGYGFAARWPDADQGEWLAAVITAPTLAEATDLRRTLFTLTFPR
jgi:hypothetical protein